jgi:hypothetical protein
VKRERELFSMEEINSIVAYEEIRYKQILLHQIELASLNQSGSVWREV